ncbi:hypothetical protein [Tropicimonas aquimaris]|uniref:Zinc-ribbon domain-containing protein n=1 Tax=Tropicimonas aquimaris TaxID=914152 RepID=A0ABW3IWT6_9RHOB
MPGPDPFGLDIEEHENGGFTITCEVWAQGNRANRIARMQAVSRNIRWTGWKCAWCYEPIPLYRRADARFCCEGCRKRAARQRRMNRQ